MRSLLPSFNLPSFMPQLRHSCMALLGRTEPTPQVLNARTEVIREMMLQELGDYGEKKFPAVAAGFVSLPTCKGCGTPGRT